MELAKAAAPFETTVGSIADFGWLLRLTNLTGSVHVPEKLATWRFHGDQLSVRRDDTRLTTMKEMCQSILPTICRHYPNLLTRNDRKLLLLPYNILLSRAATKRVGCWFEAIARLVLMLFEQPGATLRALCRAGFEVGIPRNFLLSIIFHRTGLAPRELDATEQAPSTFSGRRGPA
jgi:hypothetical protein